MSIVSKLNKRKWDAVVCIDNGKWFTGWDGDIATKPRNTYRGEQPALHKMSDIHEIRQLKVKLLGTSRGRSSAIFLFEDKDGYTYNVSMSGGEKLLKAYFADKIEREGEYLVADFVQTKQGANYFIEIVGDFL